MRRILTVLALPVTTLALAAVLLSAQSETVAGPAPSASLPRATGDVRNVDTGAPVAITKTNWQETSDGSVIVPTSPPGRPKR